MSVVIAVDLFAMLYRWNPQTQELQPTHLNRLDIFAEGDREIVEEFLIALKEPLAEQNKADAKEYERLREEWRQGEDDTDSD